MTDKLISVIVNVIEWDYQHDDDTAICLPATKYYPFTILRCEDETNQDIVERAMDLVSNKTGWCIKDCEITIVG